MGCASWGVVSDIYRWTRSGTSTVEGKDYGRGSQSQREDGDDTKGLDLRILVLHHYNQDHGILCNFAFSMSSYNPMSGCLAC
jgi:hypothetical protein